MQVKNTCIVNLTLNSRKRCGIFQSSLGNGWLLGINENQIRMSGIFLYLSGHGGVNGLLKIVV